MPQKEQRDLRERIAALRGRLLVMAQLAGNAVTLARKAVENNDLDLARRVTDEDKLIDRLEDEIDNTAISILALNQPVARDLRFVVGALRMVVDLERIGDEAVLIAESLIFQVGESQIRVRLMPETIRLFDGAQAAFARAVEALKKESIGGNSYTGNEDERSNTAEAAALHSILRNPGACGQGDLSAYLEEILMIRSLNRIWRRSDNIAEQVWFIDRGESVKHRAPGV